MIARSKFILGTIYNGNRVYYNIVESEIIEDCILSFIHNKNFNNKHIKGIYRNSIYQGILMNKNSSLFNDIEVNKFKKKNNKLDIIKIRPPNEYNSIYDSINLDIILFYDNTNISFKIFKNNIYDTTNNIILNIFKNNTKLLSNNIKTIFILEWDDIIFPMSIIITKKIQINNIKDLNDSYLNLIQKIENHIIIFLQRCLISDNVLIITHRSIAYILDLCRKFYPKLYLIIKNLPIINNIYDNNHICSISLLNNTIREFNKEINKLCIDNLKFINNIILINNNILYDTSIIQSALNNVQNKIIKSITIQTNLELIDHLLDLDILNKNFYNIKYTNSDNISNLIINTH